MPGTQYLRSSRDMTGKEVWNLSQLSIVQPPGQDPAIRCDFDGLSPRKVADSIACNCGLPACDLGACKLGQARVLVRELARSRGSYLAARGLATRDSGSLLIQAEVVRRLACRGTPRCMRRIEILLGKLNIQDLALHMPYLSNNFDMPVGFSRMSVYCMIL